jgi:hypothetical protein
MSFLTRIGAIVVNPKTGEPFFCVSDIVDKRPVRDFDIRDFNGGLQGSGYFETSKDDSYYASAKATGYPRVHTPQGVRKQGVGNGTCLYVAGACAVTVRHDREYDNLSLSEWNLNTGVSFDERRTGVSSTQERSAKASTWWSKAIKAGLAKEVLVESSESHSIDDCVRGSSAREGIEHVWGLNIPGNDNDELMLCANGDYFIGEDVMANVLTYESAYEQNLVIATFLTPFAWPLDTEGQYQPGNVTWPKRLQFISFNSEAARAVNVGVFREYDDPDDVITLYAGICIAGGMKEREVMELRERFNEGYDINEKAVLGVDDPRQNPTKRSSVDPFAGLIKSYAPARRSNPARAQRGATSAIIAGAERLAEERRRLGWQKFYALP